MVSSWPTKNCLFCVSCASSISTLSTIDFLMWLKTIQKTEPHSNTLTTRDTLNSIVQTPYAYHLLTSTPVALRFLNFFCCCCKPRTLYHHSVLCTDKHWQTISFYLTFSHPPTLFFRTRLPRPTSFQDLSGLSELTGSALVFFISTASQTTLCRHVK